MDLSLLPDGGMTWLDASGPESHIVLSTRVRLARNLSGMTFTVRSPDAERETLLGITVPRLALAPFEASAVVKLCLVLTRGVAASS